MKMAAVAKTGNDVSGEMAKASLAAVAKSSKESVISKAAISQLAKES